MFFIYSPCGAPSQEDLFLRGLVQPAWARAVSVQGGFWATHFPVVFVAALFGVIHLDSGIVVAASAVLLGLIAGELRRCPRSYFTASSTPHRHCGRLGERSNSRRSRSSCLDPWWTVI